MSAKTAVVATIANFFFGLIVSPPGLAAIEKSV
jgi:hypothetical protein